MSKSQQDFVEKHLKKKGYLQQIQALVERVNLLNTENKKKYPLKLELIHGFCYEEEEDPEYFFTLSEKKNWLSSLWRPKRKITVFFHYREDGDWKAYPEPDFFDDNDDWKNWKNGARLKDVADPCLVAQIADDFTNLEGFESKYADTSGYLYSTTKALLNGKSIWDWEEWDSRYYMNADIDEEEVINTLKKILMNITKVDFDRNSNGNEKLWNL